LPLVADYLIGGDAVTFGLLSGAFAASAVIDALASRRIRDHFSKEMTICITVITMNIGAFIVAGSSWLALNMTDPIVFGAAWLVTMAMVNAAVQMSAPR